MKKLSLGLICLTLSLHSYANEQNSSSTLTYDVFSKDKDVGDVTLQLLKTPTGHKLIEQSHIKASGWWWNLDLTTVLSEEFDKDQGLIHGDGKTFDEGTAYWTQIKKLDNAYQAQYVHIEKVTPEEEKQFKNLSFSVAGKTNSDINEALTLSKSIFADRQEAEQSTQFPVNAFDTTWNNLPFFVQKNVNKPLPETINIMDSENLEIMTAKVKDLGNASITIDDQNFETRHIQLSYGRFKPSLIWIYMGVNDQTSALPFVVRHTGEDEDGPFEIILKP